MLESDADLVNLLQNDDMSAFDKLYWKYHTALLKNILKIVKDETVAEDILQEVFIKLWNYRYKIKPDQSFSGWLFVISFNLSLNHLRNKLKETKAYSSLTNTFVSEDATIDFHEIESQYNLLQLAIASLPLQKQKVIKICKIEGKTYDEAAEDMQISKNTVKEHLTLAMAALRQFAKNNPNLTNIFLLHIALNFLS